MGKLRHGVQAGGNFQQAWHLLKGFQMTDQPPTCPSRLQWLPQCICRYCPSLAPLRSFVPQGLGSATDIGHCWRIHCLE